MKIKRLLLATLAAALLAQAQLVGAKTFRYATTGDILGLDPHANNEGPTNTMKGNIYGRLIHRKPDLSLVPDLATKWDRIGDTTWRFTLRQGVTFHNGNPFNADDVVYSFKRQTQESSEMSFALASVENLTKIDDYTVEITTKGPDPILLLNMPNFYIVDKEFMEENNAFEVVRGAGKTNFANLNANGIDRLTADGRLEALVRDERMDWPDSVRLGADGWLNLLQRIGSSAAPAQPPSLSNSR